MKKLIALSILLIGGSGLLYGAEAARSAVEEKEITTKKIKISHDAVFLNADRRFTGNSIFDAMQWEDDLYVHKSGERVVAPYVGTVDMAGIQHGAFYYVFVPNRNKNHLLVFRLTENGTIQPNEDGEKFTRIETGAPVVSVAPVKDSNNALLVAATTRASSLEVFTLVGSEWNTMASVPLSSPVEASAAAAADAYQSDVVINSILYKGIIYLFMVDDNNPQVQVATIPPERSITMHNYPELILPFTVGDMQQGKKYNIATVEQNNKLYLFVVGSRDKSNGFIYGWKLEDNGRFVPVIQKQVDRLPHNIIVNDTLDGLYITITFSTDFNIEVYKLIGTSFEGPIGQSRVNAVPIQARNVPYQDNRNVMVLVQPLRGGPYFLRDYQIDDRGAIQIAEHPLPESRIPLPYIDFLLIPGLTKQQVIRMLDEATGRIHPRDIVGSIAEFIVKNY
jgi:hypothetical protein